MTKDVSREGNECAYDTIFLDGDRYPMNFRGLYPGEPTGQEGSTSPCVWPPRSVQPTRQNQASSGSQTLVLILLIDRDLAILWAGLLRMTCHVWGLRYVEAIAAAQLWADENGLVIRLLICLDLEKG